MTTPESKFIEMYTPLLNLFITKINGVNLAKIPEPHLPVIGKEYTNAADKILFMGWETRGSKGLNEFIETAQKNPNDALFWWKDDFDSLDFVYWRSNFSRDFWSFNLKFLAKFYEIPDWKDLYKDPFSFEVILSSFAWANANSIERYEVTAKNNGVLYDDWKKVVDASDIFDNPQLIFKTLQPKVVVLMHWDQDEKKLLDGLEIEEQSKPFPEYLWYYKIKNPDMHLFWTKHPLRLHFEGVNFDEVIDKIISIYKEKNVTSILS
jgi:hypothetical protein